MRRTLPQILPPFGITLLVLIIFEIIATAFLPALGITTYRIPFNIMLILFLGFKLESIFLALMILIIQYLHSFFTLEGWALGTVSGVVVCMLISFLRDLLHLSSKLITAVVTQLFQIVWFLITIGLIYLKSGDYHFILAKLWKFIPESIILSILAPYCFSLLDKIWKLKESGMLGDES